MLAEVDVRDQARGLQVGPLRTPLIRNGGPFLQFALVGVLGMAAIVLGSLFASQKAGVGEAMAEVRSLTENTAKTVIEPNITAELLNGDPAAIAALDQLVTERVISRSAVRVKVWDSTGRIIYSDEPRLIGEVYELDATDLRAFSDGTVQSEVSSVDGVENRFETGQGKLLEVYLPIVGPDGVPLLYESYFAFAEVSESSSRIRAAFVPIIIGSLAVMETMHLALAWALSRRLRQGKDDREQLMQRAIESSDLERRRIASDLHDGVVQDLVGTSLVLSAAAETANRTSPVLAADLRTAAEGTRHSLTSLRTLLVDIYPSNLGEQGLEAAISDLLTVPRKRGIRTSLTIWGDVDRDLPAAALTYRVIQEAVRNTVRHADALHLAVTVEAERGVIAASVVDDGAGFDPDVDRPDEHLGLRFLYDLVADADGRLGVISQRGNGTTVELTVPQA